VSARPVEDAILRAVRAVRYASYKGVSPAKPFVTSGQGKGAVELAARRSRLDVDDETFPIYADPTRSVAKGDEWAVGVNWYLTRNVRIALNYDQTRYTGGAAGGADRDTEKVILTRFQVSF
jgi:phosphate-selective porin OprO/OprP